MDEIEFKIGDKVVLSEEGKTQLKRSISAKPMKDGTPRKGEIIRYTRIKHCIFVLWEGCKNPAEISTDFIQKYNANEIANNELTINQ